MVAVMAGIVLGGALVALASTNIDVNGNGYQWGWNDVIGWIDMKSTNTLTVSSSTGSVVTGYASSSVGMIVFDCSVTPSGDACGSPATWHTTNDGTGNLSGWAWNDAVGWISMSGTTAAPSSEAYGVTIAQNGALSDFGGWAWSDVAGWINFNCTMNPGASPCAVPYKTQTAGGTTPSGTGTFISSIFDIGTATGALNSLTWKGSQPGGTTVQFKIATATSSANLMATSTVFDASIWMAAAAGVPVMLTASSSGVTVMNRQYVRYEMQMSGAGSSPQIDDIVIGWSP